MRLRTPVGVASALAWALTLHTAYNVRFLRTPSPAPPTVGEPVSVLVPARDEERVIKQPREFQE